MIDFAPSASAKSKREATFGFVLKPVQLASSQAFQRGSTPCRACSLALF